MIRMDTAAHGRAATAITRRPARVLFLNSRSEYGGADMGLLSIVRTLDPQRFRAVVVLPHEGPLVASLQAAGAEVLFMDICRLERLSSAGEVWTFARRFFSSLRRLRRLIAEQQVDLVYTNSSAIPVGALAARWAGVPNVWHLREIWTSPRWLTGPLYWYIYAFADRIIAISRAVAMGNFGRAGKKIVVVHDGIDVARFENLDERAAAVRGQLGLTQSWPVVTTVARLVPQKGLTCFVDAAQRTRRAGTDAYFCIAGDIPRDLYQEYKDELIARIAAYGLSDRVFLLGWYGDVPALLAASDVFVLASIGPEGAGLVIPEAWLAGIPVIVPDHSGPREIVQDGRNGLWFHSSDADDLCDKICALLKDAGWRRDLAVAGKQDALERHDARRNTATIETVLDELLTRRWVEPYA